MWRKIITFNSIFVLFCLVFFLIVIMITIILQLRAAQRTNRQQRFNFPFNSEFEFPSVNCFWWFLYFNPLVATSRYAMHYLWDLPAKYCMIYNISHIPSDSWLAQLSLERNEQSFYLAGTHFKQFFHWSQSPAALGYLVSCFTLGASSV